MMKMYLKYDNVHSNDMNYALKQSNNHAISSIYCMLSVNRLNNLIKGEKLRVRRFNIKINLAIACVSKSNSRLFSAQTNHLPITKDMAK